MMYMIFNIHLPDILNIPNNHVLVSVHFNIHAHLYAIYIVLNLFLISSPHAQGLLALLVPRPWPDSI